MKKKTKKTSNKKNKNLNLDLKELTERVSRADARLKSLIKKTTDLKALKTIEKNATKTQKYYTKVLTLVGQQRDKLTKKRTKKTNTTQVEANPHL